MIAHVLTVPIVVILVVTYWFQFPIFAGLANTSTVDWLGNLNTLQCHTLPLYLNTVHGGSLGAQCMLVFVIVIRPTVTACIFVLKRSITIPSPTIHECSLESHPFYTLGMVIGMAVVRPVPAFVQAHTQTIQIVLVVAYRSEIMLQACFENVLRIHYTRYLDALYSPSVKGEFAIFLQKVGRDSSAHGVDV
jgi:hypothetical protein